jgi:hypothetical protein
MEAIRDLRQARAATSQAEVKTVFTDIYLDNTWEDSESRSGPGSTLQYTENIRRELPRLLSRLGIRLILDAPCGDFNWFKLVPRTDVSYLGGDIVESIVGRNQNDYGNQHTSFMLLDIIRDSLPKADLWLCRDCLFHFSNIDIFLTIDNFLRSDIKYLLTSTHQECQENTNIQTGSFRELNLERPPFSFHKAHHYIDDWIEGCPPRQLALWDREGLTRVLASNRSLRRALRSRR